MAEGIEGADDGDKGWLDLHMREKISSCNPKSFPGLTRLAHPTVCI